MTSTIILTVATSAAVTLGILGALVYAADRLISHHRGDTNR
jgi:hypothetical protein